MKKWYKQPYFNRRTWLLENFDKLNLTNDELVVLLLIDYAKEARKAISYDYLMSKLNCDSKKVDKIVEKLVQKKYLIISPNSKGVSFDIDSIFEYDPDKFEIKESQDVYSVLEDLVKRPLSPNELQKLSDLLNEFEANRIIDAIRVAEAYRKTSIAYIESILRNEKK